MSEGPIAPLLHRPRLDSAVEDDGVPAWYCCVDRWDFAKQTLCTRSLLHEEAMAETSTLRDLLRIYESPDMPTIKVEAGQWSAPLPTQRKRERQTRTLAEVADNVLRFEDLLKTYARSDELQLQAHEAGLITTCRELVDDITDQYSCLSKPIVLRLLRRMETIFLQFRNIVDPVQDCIVCAESLRRSMFPSRVTKTCLHDARICSGCLKEWVATSITERGFAQLKCIECNIALAFDDIRTIAAPDTFQR
jgi:hypothetical protein